MRFLRVGPEGLLIELDTLDEVLRLAAELRRRAPPGITEIVPAARTVLLTGTGLAELAAELPQWRPPPVAPTAGPVMTIPVSYDGPDLDAVLALTKLSRDELIGLHTGVTLSAAFCGFAPGFAYLTGLSARLRVPRHATPRTKVEAGAVGLAGGFTGIYPRAAPGGWQIIGRTALRLWDETRNPPGLIEPGARVRFVPA